MATLASTYPTLQDWAKQYTEGEGITSRIANLLAQSNEILKDAVYTQANGVTSHRSTVLAGLPSVTWRLLNYGVQPSKGTFAQVDDTMGMLEAYSKVDRSLANLNGDVSQFRMNQAMTFVEAMNQELASTIWYGNSALDPEKFTGLAPRYSSLSAGNGENIIDAGGSSTDNTSVWLVGWSPTTISMLFPKGSKAGLSHEDVTTAAPVQDAAGGLYQAYQDHWKIDTGMMVSDWRYAIRIANIDVSDLAGGSPANIARLMVRALARRPDGYQKARWAFYGNRAVKAWADIQSLEKTNMGFTSIQDAQGEEYLGFRGVPFRVNDALLNTEARVT